MKTSLREIEEIDSHLPIIINANWINAMGVIRSLALENIQSISIADDPLGRGLFSNQTIGLLGPNPDPSPEHLGQFLLDLRSHLKRPGILMVTDDKTLDALIAIDDMIQGHFLRTYPEADTADFILDKHNQYLNAKAAGVPVPFTLAPQNTSDVKNWPKELFPCIVKGRRGKRFYSMTGY